MVWLPVSDNDAPRRAFDWQCAYSKWQPPVCNQQPNSPGERFGENYGWHFKQAAGKSGGGSPGNPRPAAHGAMAVFALRFEPAKI